MSGWGRGWVGATPPPRTAGGVNQPLWYHLVTATPQTRHLTQCQPNGGQPFTKLAYQ